MTLPPRSEWTPADYLAYIEGWSFDRLGYPKPPTPGEMTRARNVGATLDHVVGVAVPAGVRATILPETRRAMFFAAGQNESKAAA